MNQIDKCAELIGPPIRDRQLKEPFFQDFCIRVVGESDAMVFELWTRRGTQATREDVHRTFRSAREAVELRFGRPISESRWRECDPNSWSLA